MWNKWSTYWMEYLKLTFISKIPFFISSRMVNSAADICFCCLNHLKKMFILAHCFKTLYEMYSHITEHRSYQMTSTNPATCNVYVFSLKRLYRFPWLNLWGLNRFKEEKQNPFLVGPFYLICEPNIIWF